MITCQMMNWELKVEKCPGCGGSGAMMHYWPATGKRKGYGPCFMCEGGKEVRVGQEVKRETARR